MLITAQKINPKLFQNAVREVLKEISKANVDDIKTLNDKEQKVKDSVSGFMNTESLKDAFDSIGGLTAHDVKAAYLEAFEMAFMDITNTDLDIEGFSKYLSGIMQYFIAEGSEKDIIEVSEGLSTPQFIEEPKTLHEQEDMKRSYMNTFRAMAKFFFENGAVSMPFELRESQDPAILREGLMQAKSAVEKIIQRYESQGQKVVPMSAFAKR